MRVYVFDYNGGEWIQKGAFLSGEHPTVNSIHTFRFTWYFVCFFRSYKALPSSAGHGSVFDHKQAPKVRHHQLRVYAL
ncbi:MAG: hypothetical protein ACOC4J_04965 [Bacteroidota bacterium]